MKLIGLADARAQCAVESDEHDAMLAALIVAATAWIEERTGYVAGAREEAFRFDRFERELELRRRPVDLETIAVAYLDGDGGEQPFTDIRAVLKDGTVRVTPAIGSAWPAAACGPSAITLTADVGFADSDEMGAADAPEPLRQAARLLVGHWFANREAVVTGTISTELQFSVDLLLEPYRLGRV
jgi:uncharacterized phiE125 gp8 family phage protein